MCLSRVIEQFDEPSTLIVGGKKEFSGTNSKPEFPSFALNGSMAVALDQWMVADTGKSIKASDGKSYDSGFHVYDEDTQEMNKKPYRRVFVRKVTTIGEEGVRRVVIAQEMYVPSDPNGWPPKPGESTPKKSMLDKIKDGMRPGNA